MGLIQWLGLSTRPDRRHDAGTQRGKHAATKTKKATKQPKPSKGK
jgi:hypothetical protein